MNRFWDIIIEPTLKMVDAKKIVEIGSQDGKNTKKIIEFCKKTNGVIYSIDPSPLFDYEEWLKQNPDHFIFFKDLSLNALPKINDYDAILIDGDHNWYTVYNELKIVEKTFKESDKFPLIYLHDIGWPYGRRDLYYNPENIPLIYQHPYKKLGLSPTTSNLTEEGLNSHLNNAIYENNIRNGVLTAIEDFLDETNLDLDFIKLEGFHGLGIIVPKIGEYVRVVNYLRSPSVLTHIIRKIEEDRVQKLIEIEKQRKTINKIKEQLSKNEEELERLNQILLKQNELYEVEINKKIKELEEEFKQKEENYISQLASTKKDISQLNIRLQKAERAAKIHLNSIRYRLGDIIISALIPSKNTLLFPIRLSKLVIEGINKKINIRVKNVKNNENFISENASNINNQKLTSYPYSVDIVVCVHNALNDVKICLNSLISKKTMDFNLIIVDDGSDKETKQYLKSFSNKYNVTLISNSSAKGYTIAANQGLRESKGKYCVLLNSDTIVTYRWLEKLINCIESSEDVGIVGPLSNAASWQSVPEIKIGNDWAVNVLEKDISLEQMSVLVEAESNKKYPDVPFVNGFCFMIKRSVINKIGYLDEETFPIGYGEENDYCIRAREAGFRIRVADDCYIYHQKSKSFTHEKRRELAKNARRLLIKKYGEEVLKRDEEQIRENHILQSIRQKIKMRLISGEKIKNNHISVLFILPVKGGSGGAHSVVQETIGLREIGVNAKIATLLKYKDVFLSNYPEIANHCIFYENEDELSDYAQFFDIAVGTIFTSIKTLKEILAKNPNVIPAYYIQDYEPWFFTDDNPLKKEAEESYEIIPEIKAFAKTQWLCNIVKEKHGLDVYKVEPSLDRNLYKPDFSIREKNKKIVHVVAMVRPHTPRRSPKETMIVLEKIKQKYNEKVNISIFGCDDKELTALGVNLNFKFTNHGVLKREEVAQLLKRSDIFIDLSSYQAFGRTGLEAMAVGCSVILPKYGGTNEYAIHGYNSFLVDVNEIDNVISYISKLIEDETLREEFISRGLITASNYSIEKAALSEYLFFKEIINSCRNLK